MTEFGVCVWYSNMRTGSSATCQHPSIRSDGFKHHYTLPHYAGITQILLSPNLQLQTAKCRLATFCWQITHTHTHTPLTALFQGLPGWAGTRKVKPIWILLKQETVSGSGISWAICKSEPHSRQITTPAPHHSVFYRPNALPAAQQTASKHWKQIIIIINVFV